MTRGKPQTITLKEVDDELYEVKKTVNLRERIKIGDKKTWVEVKKWIDSDDVYVVIK